MAASTQKHHKMSAQHKAALAQGRAEGLAVRRYLEALEANKPRRGRPRTPDTIQNRLAFIQSERAYVDALTNLHYLQEQKDLEAELARSDTTVDIAPLV